MEEVSTIEYFLTVVIFSQVETILPRCYEAGVLVDSFLVLKEKCTDTMFYLFSTNTDRGWLTPLFMIR